jgi:hypothetical protein
MKCQVGRSPGSVALQGKLLAGTCRVTGGTRGMLRVEAMVDWCAPGVRAGCRGIRSGVGANAGPGTGITCNHTARRNGGAKSWPYRPESQGGRFVSEVLRVCARFAATCVHRPLVRSGLLIPPGAFHGSRSFLIPVLAFVRSWCVCQQYAFAGLSTSLALLRFPPDCSSGPVAFTACKASSISLA